MAGRRRINEFRDEEIKQTAGVIWLRGIDGREIPRIGLAQNINTAGRIYGNTKAGVTAAAAKVSRIGDGRSGCIEFGHEGVEAAAGRPRQGIDGGEVG